ncbi:MAG: hypothetical protein ACFB0G_11495 [Leptolyngbyaceae cyanobacterium]
MAQTDGHDSHLQANHGIRVWAAIAPDNSSKFAVEKEIRRSAIIPFAVIYNTKATESPDPPLPMGTHRHTLKGVNPKGSHLQLRGSW